MRPYEGEMTCYPVGAEVNNPENDDEELIKKRRLAAD